MKEIKIFDNEVKKLKPKRIRFSKEVLSKRHNLETLIKCKQ